MRKLLLLTLVVLVVCTLGFAQVTRDSAMQQFNKALATGKAQLVMPMAAPGTHAKSTAMFSGQKLLVKSSIKPTNVPTEPWFCDYNNGSQVLVCPKGVETAYSTNFPGANGGAGMTVAIVDYFYYNWVESALAQYNHDMGLPPCTVANGCLTLIDMSNGNECDYCYGWEVETMLDVEAVHAMAPNAKIVFIGGDPYGYGTAEELTAESLGDATSNSWTFNAGESVDPIFGPVLGQGPPTLFASGDGSYFPAEGIAYPCTSPDATCVGGTSLYLNPGDDVCWLVVGERLGANEPERLQGEDCEKYEGNRGARTEVAAAGENLVWLGGFLHAMHPQYRSAALRSNRQLGLGTALAEVAPALDFRWSIPCCAFTAYGPLGRILR